MRRITFIGLCLIGTVALTGCKKSSDAEVERALENVNVIDESNLNDIMLTVADPNEAVDYFKRATNDNPDRMDLQRGLAHSLIRAKKPREAKVVWEKVVASPEGGNEDRVNFADSLIRLSEWKQAEEVLDKIPPTHETFKRYRLEAMIADSNREWDKADVYYETAVGLTTKPANVLNNWGFSKLTRGDFAGAERLFVDSISYDSSLFTAKNNLILARGAQRNYKMPIVPMTQVEKAQLLHTLALSAIKQGDTATGRSLLNEAIETHPQYFAEAVRSLETLDSGKTKS